ncbi:MAG: hypothetical protein IK145_05170 [Bacteroidales bacterium]|nr:hypothetical protein [Bacteroidales bacterium]
MNMLLGADRYIGSSPSGSLTRTEGSMVYDRNGNITALKRYGDTGLDNDLSFTLTGNRMTGLYDGGTNTGTFSYAYDAMGNQTSDGRQGLLFCYNILNLPCGVTSATSGSLTYTYLADGTKVSAVKSDGSGKRYVGSMVYSVPASGGGSETFESASWDEGRIGFTKSGSTYTLTDLWFVKDHLGDVRTMVDVSPVLSSPQVLERNDYLPFGTRMSAGTATLATNRYRLGGKEEQSFGSLDLGKVDFSARMYDPFSARWTTQDPMAAKYVSMSPYSYCAGNPVNIVDPAGLDWYLFNEDGDYMYRIEADGEHRIVLANNHKDKQGNTVLTYDFFDFADPIHDPEDIDNGIINTIIRVSSEEVFSMLSSQGAFSKGPHSLAFESTRGDIFDYSFSLLKNVYAKNVLKIKEGNIQSNALFLPDGEKTAHNLMNFGNFLWGATGYTLEYPENVLLFGADVNSRLGGKRNGYGYQPDSPDDQLSITLGIRFAKKNQYRNPSFKHHGR